MVGWFFFRSAKITSIEIQASVTNKQQLHNRKDFFLACFSFFLRELLVYDYLYPYVIFLLMYAESALHFQSRFEER